MPSATTFEVPVTDVRPIPRPTRLFALTATMLGLAATAVSAYGSWVPSLWGDEVASILSARRSLPSLFRMLGNVDAVHGTYYFFLHFWIEVFGSSAFSVRFPSALAVGVMVVGVVVLGTRLSGPRVGFIAGLISVALPRVTYMGEEARSYAFSAAAIVWLTYLLVWAINSAGPKRRHWVLYGAGVAASAYIFLFSLLILMAHALIVYSARKKFSARSWVIATAWGLVAALPVIAYGIGERGQIAFLSARNAAAIHTLLVTQWFGNDQAAIICWGLLIIALVMGVIAARNRKHRSGISPLGGYALPHLVPLAAVWLFGSMIVLLVANAIHPVYSSRYLSFAVPAAALLLGWMLVRIRPRWLAAVLLVGVIGFSLPSYFDQRTAFSKNNSDWAQIAATIKANARRGEAVLFDESTRPSLKPRLSMRAYPESYAGLVDVGLKTPYYNTISWRDSASALSAVPQRLDGIDTVWMIEYHLSGHAASTYNQAELARLGFRAQHTYREHASDVIKYVRG